MLHILLRDLLGTVGRVLVSHAQSSGSHPSLYKSDVVVQAYNPSLQKGKAGGWKIQGHSHLHSDLRPARGIYDLETKQNKNQTAKNTPPKPKNKIK